MWPRLLALLLVAALVPTAELTEQAVHVVGHVLDGEEAAHSAHHEGEAAGDEHGCTGLIHLCPCHQTVAMTPTAAAAALVYEPSTSAMWSPARLHDLAPREPADRPPIG